MTWVWNLLGPEFLEYPQILPKDEDEDKWGIHKTLDLSCGSLQENTSFTLALLIFSTDVTILLMHLFESKLTTSVVISIPLCCRAWLRRVLKFCRSNTPYVVFFPPFCIPNFQYGQNDGNFCKKQFPKARKWKKERVYGFHGFHGKSESSAAVISPIHHTPKSFNLLRIIISWLNPEILVQVLPFGTSHK